ncbi:MAG: PAS domain S-box protein, partial [Candidatus Hydrothermarchaeaceae archaeon]
MNNRDKTKEQLKYELKEIQQRVAELEVSKVNQRQTEEQLQKRTHDLGERVKELDCLYGISNVAEKRGVPLEEMLQEIVSTIPPSWQYPEITCARITLNSQEFVTGNFRKTAWKQTSDITVFDNRAGSVEVYYLEKMQKIDEGPFLREERNLINAIAERVGRIIEQKQAEEQLQANENWLSTTLRSIGDAVIATDAEGHVTLMNHTAQILTAWDEEDALGHSLEDVFNIVNEKTGKQGENPVAKVIREGVVVGLANHTILIAKDGTRCPIDDSGAPIIDDKGTITGVILIFRDFTEHRQMEDTLVESEAKYRSFVETSMDMIAVVDLNGNYTFVNNAWINSSGFSQETSREMNSFDYIHPDDILKAQASFETLLNGNNVENIEQRFKISTGKYIDTLVNLSPLTNSQGEIYSILALSRDITDRKQLEEQLRHSQVLASLGEMTAGIAHEVGNPLASIVL